MAIWEIKCSIEKRSLKLSINYGDKAHPPVAVFLEANAF